MNNETPEMQQMRMRIVLGHSLRDWEDLASAAQELVELLAKDAERIKAISDAHIAAEQIIVQKDEEIARLNSALCGCEDYYREKLSALPSAGSDAG